MKATRVWKICMDCKKKMRRFRKYKKLMLCFKCYQKRMKIIGGRSKIFSLEKALSQVYEIRGYLESSTGKLKAIRTFPSVLIGHKVKLQLIK